MSRLNRAVMRPVVPAPQPAAPALPAEPVVAAAPPPPPPPPLPVEPPPVVAEAQLLPGYVTQPEVQTRSVSPEQPAVVDLVSQIVNSQRKVGQLFYVVVFAEDADPCVESYPTIEALIRAIRSRIDAKTECGFFPFLGYKLAITKGPLRFLKTPFGANIPLFDAHGDDLEEEPYGWIGSEPLESVVMPPPEHVEQVEQLDDSEQGDEAGGELPVDDTSPFDVGGRASAD